MAYELSIMERKQRQAIADGKEPFLKDVHKKAPRTNKISPKAMTPRYSYLALSPGCSHALLAWSCMLLSLDNNGCTREARTDCLLDELFNAVKLELIKNHGMQVKISH